MIPVEFHRGLHLPEADLWLDPWDAKPNAFVSHAHADHFARHGLALCSDVTAALVRARYGVAPETLRAERFHVPFERLGHRFRLLPAGHIRGSTMLHVTRLADGATLLYTGDFKTRKSRTSEPVAFQQADLLILETTFALPRHVFPPPLEVEAAILRFVHTALDDGDVPVLLGYSLGKAQEALALLHAHDIPALLHPAVAEMTAACRATGLDCLPEPEILRPEIPPGHAIIAPPNAVRSKLLTRIKNRRTVMLSGWALDPSARYRYRTDDAIPLSDHADHPGLLDCVNRVRPKKVLTVHGYAREFAAELRHQGIEAWSAAGRDQLELAIAGPAGRGRAASISSASPRHVRPICPLADFTDLCRLVGETNSRLEKTRLLADYLRHLNGALASAGLSPQAHDPSVPPTKPNTSHARSTLQTLQTFDLGPSTFDIPLPIAATWLTGRPLPRTAGSLHTGIAALRRALLSLPGAREDRYRAISATQNDAARTARLVLQEISLKPEPLDLPGLAAFFRTLADTSGSIARIELLADRLSRLHPAEGETVVRLLTGDLRIGLKEGLVEEAVATAFEADPEEVRHAHMLTGDLGETTLLARAGQLDTAALRPFAPVKIMLASPEQTPTAILTRHLPQPQFASSASPSPASPSPALITDHCSLDTPAQRALWLEPKYDGIRAQLHKHAGRVSLYSRDLRPLDVEFPDLLQAAADLPGDLILDGEIIAHAEGKRLTFFDLQKRLGRRHADQLDLFSSQQSPISNSPSPISIPPVRFVAFDCLFQDGRTLLHLPLADRRAVLELALVDPPPAIALIGITRAASLEETEAAFKSARADGHEGLISKDPASSYTPGRRGKAWLKLKGVMPTLDCVVVAAEQGHGKRAEVLSDYTFALRDLDTGELRVIGKAYTGLTDLEIEELTDHFRRHTVEKQRRKHLVEPDTVLEIAFDSIQPSKRHDSGLALRFPRIRAIRRDKTPQEIDTLQYARSLTKEA